jgi:hypothetical protein
MGEIMKYVFAITALAFITAFVAASVLLPDTMYILAGSHKGHIYYTGFGVYMFAFYIAALFAGFGVFMPGTLLQEWLQERERSRFITRERERLTFPGSFAEPIGEDELSRMWDAHLARVSHSCGADEDECARCGGSQASPGCSRSLI